MKKVFWKLRNREQSLEQANLSSSSWINRFFCVYITRPRVDYSLFYGGVARKFRNVKPCVWEFNQVCLSIRRWLGFHRQGNETSHQSISKTALRLSQSRWPAPVKHGASRRQRACASPTRCWEVELDSIKQSRPTQFDQLRRDGWPETNKERNNKEQEKCLTGIKKKVRVVRYIVVVVVLLKMSKRRRCH